MNSIKSIPASLLFAFFFICFTTSVSGQRKANTGKTISKVQLKELRHLTNQNDRFKNQLMRNDRTCQRVLGRVIGAKLASQSTIWFTKAGNSYADNSTPGSSPSGTPKPQAGLGGGKGGDKGPGSTQPSTPTPSSKPGSKTPNPTTPNKPGAPTSNAPNTTPSKTPTENTTSPPNTNPDKKPVSNSNPLSTGYIIVIEIAGTRKNPSAAYCLTGKSGSEKGSWICSEEDWENDYKNWESTGR